MNPGQSIRSVASITSAAFVAGKECSTVALRSPAMPTPVCSVGLSPRKTLAPLIRTRKSSRSTVSGTLDEAGDHRLWFRVAGRPSTGPPHREKETLTASEICFLRPPNCDLFARTRSKKPPATASAVHRWRGDPARRPAIVVAFSVFAQVLLPILVVVGSGYLLQRRLELDLQSVNRLSLYLLSPALIFSSLAQSRIEVAETLRIGAFMTLFVISIGAVTWLVALLLQLDTIDRAALMLCVMFMNAGNYGLPAARFAFGQEGFDRAVLFFVVQAILAQTLAIYIAGAGHGDRRGGLVRLLRMPQIYAVLGALAVRFGGLRLDPAGEGILNDVFRGVALVGDAAVPLLLIILGLQLAETGRISEGPKVALATVLRLGLSVPLAVGLSYLLNLDELSTKLAVMLSSMPTAVNVTILAIEFNVRPRFVSSVVVVSTAASVFTLTLILVLLGVS